MAPGTLTLNLLEEALPAGHRHADPDPSIPCPSKREKRMCLLIESCFCLYLRLKGCPQILLTQERKRKPKKVCKHV